MIFFFYKFGYKYSSLLVGAETLVVVHVMIIYFSCKFVVLYDIWHSHPQSIHGFYISIKLNS